MSLGDTPLGCVVDPGVGRIFGVVRCSSVRSRIGAGMGSRVELYAAIRFDWQRNQMSIRALADKYGVHRRTVREAVASRRCQMVCVRPQPNLRSITDSWVLSRHTRWG